MNAPESTTRAAPADAATAAFPPGTPLHPDLLAGMPQEMAFAAWQVLRSVSLWTAEPPERRVGMFDPAHTAAWERALLTAALDPEVRFPLAVVVGELGSDAPHAGRLSWACVCVADWLLGRGARRAALAFAEAAALASPEHPRYAWLVGRLMRSHGDPRSAERWLRRALRLAVEQRDWETQVRTLSALGNLNVETGRYPDARDWHMRALRISRRWRLREHEAMTLHDLFVIATEEGNRDEAERHARDALAAYASPAQIRKLAHDVAYSWMMQGHFGRALQVFAALRPRFGRPDAELRIVANLSRAAAGAGDSDGFERYRAEAEALVSRLVTKETLAPALLEIARGAAALGDWGSAAVTARRAIETAAERNEANVRIRAEELLAGVERRDPVAVGTVAPKRPGGTGEALVTQFVDAISRNEPDPESEEGPARAAAGGPTVLGEPCP